MKKINKMTRIHVAVGIVANTQGEILITRRSDHVHQGGLWEFPGGKVEDSEDVERALVRELKEELGIEVLKARPLLLIHHRYPDKQVLLDVWRVEHYAGQPQGLESQPLDWVAPEALSCRAFPAADAAIIESLQTSAASVSPNL